MRTSNPTVSLRTISHYGVSTAINFGSIFLALAARFVVDLQVGAAAFGAFTVWFNSLMLFGLIGTAGYQNFALREIAGAESQQNARMVTALSVDGARISAFVGLLAGIVGALFYRAAQGGTWLGAVTLAVATPLVAILTSLSAVHRARGYAIIGISFDRVMYQLLFIVGLIGLGQVIQLSSLVEPIFVACLLLSVLASTTFLVGYERMKLSAFVRGTRIWDRLVELAPYFAMVGVFTANSRYLLGLAGIVFTGTALGKVGFDFTISSVIALPTATLNLVFGPPIARMIAQGPAREARRRAMHYIALNFLCSAAVAIAVLATYAMAIKIARIPWSGDYGLIRLLVVSTAVSGTTNGLIIISQFQGSATRTAWMLCGILVAKIVIGGALVLAVGFEAMIVTDIILGLLFFGLILVASLRDFARNSHPAGEPA
jgi:O-antigen/teichoic acid export membrane protein